MQVSNGQHHHGHHANANANGMPPAQEPYGATAPNGMNGGYGGSNGHSNPYANGNAPVGADTGYGGQYKTHAVNDVALAEADNRHHHHHQQQHPSGPAGANANGYDAAPAGGPVGLGAGEGTYTRGPGPHSPQNNTGTGTGTTAMDNTSAGGVGGAPIAQTEREAAKLQRKGKMEHVLGSITCSSNLQHKGDLHKAQAGQLKMQAQELSEAERLEHEAGMRRHRAVGLGADPVHANGATGLGQGRTGTAQAGY